MQITRKPKKNTLKTLQTWSNNITNITSKTGHDIQWNITEKKMIATHFSRSVQRLKHGDILCKIASASRCPKKTEEYITGMRIFHKIKRLG